MRPKIGRADQYVTGIAAAFYCTCDRWPRTWDELRAFDDSLHTITQRAGKPAVPRFPWADYKDMRLGTSAEEGYLTIDFGSGADSGAQDVAVPYPDCSRFDRAAYTDACAGAPR